MKSHYTDEKNTLILISLLKKHGIKKIIVSPGATNVSFVASIQQDSFFEIYSAVDERSAAYMACGLAAESREAVALSCTGATASRNYIPGLTEAYYRKLPILAITSTQHTGRVGHNIPQVIDRSVVLKDIVKMTVDVPIVHEQEDYWACEIKVNNALLELKRHGGGPVHINLSTNYSNNFNVVELPDARYIQRIGYNDKMPIIDCDMIGIFVGAHKKWSDELIEVVDLFCEKYNGVVFCDQISNYTGKYRVFPGLVCNQKQYSSPLKKMGIMIHIGDVSEYALNFQPSCVWRVNPDGEIRDTFKKLNYVFEMEEYEFFYRYVKENDNFDKKVSNYFNEWKEECNRLQGKIGDLPFSNAWIAQQTSSRLPQGVSLHLGILNSLRCWNFFEATKGVLGYSNTGGFGIDGGVSSLIGASLADQGQLFFGVVGDLAFFYDMNSIGNRHIGNNIRLLVVNNGKGTEFRNYNHRAACFGEDTDLYIAASGHYGCKSQDLLKHYATDLGFVYISASNKEDYLKHLDLFLNPKITDKSVIFEVFTNSTDESAALEILHNLERSGVSSIKGVAKNFLEKTGIKK